MNYFDQGPVICVKLIQIVIKSISHFGLQVKNVILGYFFALARTLWVELNYVDISLNNTLSTE